uniref:LRRCT domain-containing protein n=1 Tax=Magallana gigas TaxID=29159 RepID=A0A8W8J0A6_MAGGI
MVKRVGLSQLQNHRKVGKPAARERYVGGNPFQCTCNLQSFVEFMKGFLPYNELFYAEPTCSSPDHFKGKEIIKVFYHNMSCDSTSKPAVTLPKTEDDVSTQPIIKTTPRIGDQHTTEPAVTLPKTEDDVSSQPIIKTTSRIGDQHTTEPAVTLPKTKDDVPTQQIIKTTPRIGDQQTTEPAVTFTKSKDGALTRQTVKTTPRIGDQHTTVLVLVLTVVLDLAVVWAAEERHRSTSLLWTSSPITFKYITYHWILTSAQHHYIQNTTPEQQSYQKHQ